MSSHTHRGAGPAGPLQPSVDRRTLELDEALRGAEVAAGALPALGFMRDPTRAAMAVQAALGRPGRVAYGVVIHPLPGVHWYKVQLGDGGGWVAACAGARGSLLPLGPKDLDMPGPNEAVLVFRPDGLDYGVILCAVPSAATDGAVSCPDWVVQGGGSGLRREAGHQFPVTGTYRSGGVLDWSAQRPLDQTPLERGWVTPTGLAVTIDDDMVQVRANEMAGLWVTSEDGWVRLAGQHLVVESPVHEVEACDDEGEARYFEGCAAYPHEALGQYAAGQAWTQEYDDQAVQYTSHKAKVDLPDGQEDLQPIYRYQEYGGYLGQGRLRLVVKPARTVGARRYSAPEPDTTLFMESVGLDGAATYVSAKSVHIGKRGQLPVFVQRQPVQARAGDDAAAGNYRFSSLFGAGAGHRIGDVEVTGPNRALRTVAAVLDLIAHAITWKPAHPFHYHANDYRAYNPSELADLTRNQEVVSYADYTVPDPAPVRLTIDHRYGQVEYFMRESFIRFEDDGGVHLGGGAGEGLVFAGGRVYLDGPLGVEIRSGGEVAALGDQFVVRARGSVDLSSTEKDVRLKAEGNMQLLAGNGGRGGVLIESSGEGAQQQFKNRYGEDVVSNGVIVRAGKAPVAVLAKDVYLRTGGADLEEGDILLDASRGNRRVQVFGREFHTYTTSAVTFNYGPVGETSTVNKAYYFGEEAMIADVRLILGGPLVGYNGGGGAAGVVVDGGVYGTKAFATAGVMADKKGMFLGKVPGGFAGSVQAATQAAAEAADELRQAAETRHETTVVQKYYRAGQVGNDEVVELARFGFRDPLDSTRQYKTDGFVTPEARWQQFIRFGLATGGTTWVERPVVYQGRETYPWPGKQKWADEPTLLELAAPTMSDPGAGRDADAPGPYETAAAGAVTPTVPNGRYRLARP